SAAQDQSHDISHQLLPYPLITKLTNRPGTTITFTSSLPLSKSRTFSSARAADSSCVLSASVATEIFARSLPLICTGTSTVSSLANTGSNSGQGSYASDCWCPSACQSSSAMCGANGESSRTSFSSAS